MAQSRAFCCLKCEKIRARSECEDGKVYFAYETGNQTTVKGSESVGKKCEGFTLSKLDNTLVVCYNGEEEPGFL
eukprot:gene5507-6192_t